ncbi:MAG: hypothetical protein ACJ8GN_25825 [Longimicrobiaceae bacterium]
MQHLTCEDLARLVDEPPLPHEAAHVRDCLVCRRELDEMREQTLALGALDDPELPPGGWAALEAVLRDEGLISTTAPARAWGGWREGRPLLRVAAALALFLLGGAAGAALWSSRPDGRVATTEPTRGEPVVVHPSSTAPLLVASPADVPVAPGSVDAAGAPAASPSGARLAANGAAARPAPVDPVVRQAEQELAEAEGAYLAALQRYAAIADPASGADPVTRMAALERMISATRDALERSPGDPVINGYHLAAVRERDALSRQLAAADKDWF